MANARILIAEDDAITALEIEYKLQALGYEIVATAASGEEVIQSTRRLHPDLVLMDITLQGEMDGVSTAEQIHAQDDVPIIYLTAYAEEDILQRAMITGPYGYLIKPFETRELRWAIEMALYKRQLDQQLKESENRFRNIYDHSPLPIWEEDLSAVKAYLDRLQASGIKDFRDYFDAHFEEIKEINSLIRLVDINQTGLAFFKGLLLTQNFTKEDLKKALKNQINAYLTQKSFELLKEEFICYAEGITSVDHDIFLQISDHDLRFLRMKVSVMPGYEDTFSRALVTVIDFTEQFKTEEELRQLSSELEKRVEERTAELSKANETLRQEIVERIKAEQALQESEERFRTLVENIPGSIYRCEPAPPWRYIYNSEGIQALTGLSVKELYESPILYNDMTLPEDRERVNGEMTTAIAEKRPFIIEYRLRHMDGSIRWVYEKGQSIYSEQGQPLWLAGIILDVTEKKEAEAALRLSEERFRTLVEDIPGYVYRCEPTPPWHYIYGSEEGTKTLTGYTNKELFERFVLYADLILPEDREIVDREITTAIAEKRLFIIEYRLRHRDGSIYWVYEKGKAIYSEQGQPLWLDGIVFDITEQKEAEAALRLSEERYRTLMSNIPGALYHSEAMPPYRTIYIYGEIEAISGYPSESFIYDKIQSYPALILPEDSRHVDEVVSSSIAEKKPYTIEYRIRHADGSLRWVSEKGRAVYSEQGEALCVDGVIIDITELKRAEAALRESEQRFRAIADFVEDWEIWLDPQGKMIYTSPSALQVTGYSATEFYKANAAGTNIFENIILPEDIDLYQQHIPEGGDDSHKSRIEIRITRKDGEMRWLEHTCFPVYGRDGKWLGRRASNRDITESKHVQDALRDSEQTLRSLFNAITESVFIIDPNGIVLEANDISIQRLGTTRDRLIGTSIFDFTPPEITAKRKQAIADAIQSRQLIYYKDSRQGVVYAATLYPIVNTRGAIEKVAVFSRAM